MAKQADWSGVSEILGRAFFELKNEMGDIAKGKSADVREGLAHAMDSAAGKIRHIEIPARKATAHSHTNTGRLPLILGIGGALIGAVLLARGHHANSTSKGAGI